MGNPKNNPATNDAEFLNMLRMQAIILDPPKCTIYDVAKFYLIKDQQTAAAEIIPHCYKLEEFKIVANVFRLIAAYSPDCAHQIFPLIALDSLPKEAKPEFILGTVLGLFQAGAWIMNRPSTAMTEFETRLPDVLAEIITSKHEIIKKADCLIAEYRHFENLLSEAVKKYLGEGIAKIHHPGIHQIAIELYSSQGVNLDEKYSKLGSMIIAQLFYKFVSNLESWRYVVILNSFQKINA
jgi:hypothetical protein